MAPLMFVIYVMFVMLTSSRTKHGRARSYKWLRYQKSAMFRKKRVAVLLAETRSCHVCPRCLYQKSLIRWEIVSPRGRRGRKV
ncbi:hypothetical protein F5Y14DRAFT_404154, partial [Nemania sp. NC0429]